MFQHHVSKAEMFLSQLSEIFTTPSRGVRSLVIGLLEDIIQKLEQQHQLRQHGRTIVGTGWSYHAITPEEQEAITYLIDKRIIAPSVHPGLFGIPHRRYGGGAIIPQSFRADYERAVAYYNMLTGGDVSLRKPAAYGPKMF